MLHHKCFFNSKHLLGSAFKPATMTPPITKQPEIGESECSSITQENSDERIPIYLLYLYFFKAAPKLSQTQEESNVAASKPFPGMGGHPVPESGQTHHCICVHTFFLHVLVPSFLSTAWPRFRPAGAVLPLALGLIITALLLIMIGCRLGLVRRKLKKARPLTTEESDYLINGMYL